MVRAGAVNHPFKWMHGGYREIQKPPKRYAIIDLRELTSLCGFADSRDFQIAHHQWVEKTFNGRHTVRDDRWSESIAVGKFGVCRERQERARHKALHRTVEHRDGAYALREPGDAYNGDLGTKSEPLRLENPFFWNENLESACT